MPALSQSHESDGGRSDEVQKDHHESVCIGGVLGQRAEPSAFNRHRSTDRSRRNSGAGVGILTNTGEAGVSDVIAGGSIRFEGAARHVAAGAAVALLGSLHKAVAATSGVVTHARGADTGVPGLDSANGAATVAVVCISVVAALARFDASVAANRVTGTNGGCRTGAGPSRLGITAGIATVAGRGIAVVALLGSRLDTVAASRMTRHSRRGTGPSRLDITGGVTTISGRGIPIVAGLSRVEGPVAAGRVTSMAGIAGSRGAVAGPSVRNPVTGRIAASS